jgi:hypothetical protein
MQVKLAGTETSPWPDHPGAIAAVSRLKQLQTTELPRFVSFTIAGKTNSSEISNKPKIRPDMAKVCVIPGFPVLRQMDHTQHPRCIKQISRQAVDF